METYKEPVIATPEDSVSPQFDPNVKRENNYYIDEDSLDKNIVSPEYATTSPAYDPSRPYDPTAVTSPKLFEDEPELQQFYDNMKPKNKARLEPYSDKEKRWLVE